MRLKKLELSGFKSFAKPTTFLFDRPITAIVGPNGSGKSNCAEAFRWVLGERSIKSLRGGRGEDLIWNGLASAGGGRQNRAAVMLHLDNRDRRFNLDFDEVTIGREVYRDGNNVYLINGSPVRWRDVLELLASVALGASAHFIVSQGDADRILSASASERREMVADALGLRLYQWKIEESEKKLAKTEENLTQVASLRRELAPHLRFLRKQMEKVEQAAGWRRELKQLYLEYLRREDDYLNREVLELKKLITGPARELTELEKKLAKLAPAGPAASDAAGAGAREKIAQLADERRALAARRGELVRALGRVEGRLEAARARVGEAAAERQFSAEEVQCFGQDLTGLLDEAETLFDLAALKNLLGRVRQALRDFFARDQNAAGVARVEETTKWEAERVDLERELGALTTRETTLQASAAATEKELNRLTLAARERERESYEWRARHLELSAELRALTAREANWRAFRDEFNRELNEAAVLVDQEVKRYRELTPAYPPEVDSTTGAATRSEQEVRRRQLEKMKIRLEALGVDGGETAKEYRETSERDEFLAKEVADLEAAATSLQQVIGELRERIDREFREGVAKVNERFHEFFQLMFGGGAASLTLVKEKPLTEDEAPIVETAAAEGLAVKVNLPRKKIHSLEMLSGGERALTSIALLFALSQVNPPPFLILDETDAALDEANSRKYGEMVENLARHSQLVLITHNRETMSRAGVLYGVTMGADGVSKLLSLQFDEATGYAK